MPTVASFVTERPTAVRVFQRHQIDFCCGGQRSLETVGGEKGLELPALLKEVEEEEQWVAPSTVRWDQAPIPELIAHILNRHHRPLDQELPRLSALMQKVCTVHHDRAPAQFEALQATWKELLDDLVPHIANEENMLFLWILSGLARDVAGPIRMMESEHLAVGGLLARLRVLTGDYQVPADACGSWRALWNGLEALEADLHAHIHLENNILIPRILN